MRERYWNFYTSIKYKSCYYMYYQIFVKRINIGISCFLSCVTISSIAAWNFWKTYPFLWSGIICLSQIIQAVLPNLPYFDLLIPVKLMISAVDRQLLDIDHDWLIIETQGLSEDQIINLLEKHQNRYADLVDQFFSGEYLPIIKYCVEKAEEECNTYFSVTYQIPK